MIRLPESWKLIAGLALSWTSLSCCGGGDSSDLLIPFVEKGGEKWGYVSAAGTVVIEPKFDRQPTLFYDGFALIQDNDGEYTFIDREGVVVSDDYKHATLFNQGLAFVVEEGEHPVAINGKFEVVFEMADATMVGSFSEGMARFADENGTWGFVDRKGAVVIEPECDVVTSFHEGFALVTEMHRVRRKQKTGFIDKTGAMVIAPGEGAERMFAFNEGVAAFTRGNGWGYLNEKGDTVIEPDDDWVKVSSFVNGYASVLEHGRWSVIDKKGKRVLKTESKNAPFFVNGLAAAGDADRGYGFIDIKGVEVIKPEFDEVAMPFMGPCAIVRKGNTYEFIDKKGESCGDVEMEKIDSSLRPSLFFRGTTYDPDARAVLTDVPYRP